MIIVLMNSHIAPPSTTNLRHKVNNLFHFKVTFKLSLLILCEPLFDFFSVSVLASQI
jgi:hypothetical protein